MLMNAVGRPTSRLPQECIAPVQKIVTSQHFIHVENALIRCDRAGANRANAVKPAVSVRARFEIRSRAEIVCGGIDVLGASEARNHILGAVTESSPVHVDLLPVGG